MAVIEETKEVATSAISNELDKQLVEILRGVTDSAGTAKDFVLAELPDVISQMLMWYGVYNFILFIISIVLFVVVGWAWKKFGGVGALRTDTNKRHWTLSHNDRGEFDAHMVASLFVTAIPIIIASVNINLEWLKIWIAPKLWLIEYTAQLVRQMITKAIKESLNVVRTVGRATEMHAMEAVLVPLFINALITIIFTLVFWVSWDFPEDKMMVFRVAVIMVFFYWIPASVINYIHNKLN